MRSDGAGGVSVPEIGSDASCSAVRAGRGREAE